MCQGFSTMVLFEFTDSSVRMFNDMDQTWCPMLLYFLLYGCTWKKKKKKKNVENEWEILRMCEIDVWRLAIFLNPVMHRDDSDLWPHVGGERSISNLRKFKVLGQNYLAGFLASPRALWSYKARYVAALLNRWVQKPAWPVNNNGMV